MTHLAIGYARVSTPRQAEEGVSLDTQRERITRHCEHHEWRLVNLFSDEGISARTTKKRIGLEKAMRKVCATKGVLVVFSLTRFARSVVDTYRLVHRLDQAGASLASVCESFDTTTAMGRAFFGLLSVFAQLESDQMGERIAAANAHQTAELGYRKSGVQPFGYRLDSDGVRVVDHSEQEVIDRIVELRRRKHSPKEIAQRLNSRGVPSLKKHRGYAGSENAVWHPGTIYDLLIQVDRHLGRLDARKKTHLWTDADRALLGTMPDGHLAKNLGCSRHMVFYERKRLGVSSFR